MCIMLLHVVSLVMMVQIHFVSYILWAYIVSIKWRLVVWHSICLHSMRWNHGWWLWSCAVWIGGPRGQGGSRSFRGGSSNRSVPNAHVRSEIKDVDQVRKEREKKAQRASYLKSKKGKKAYKGGKKGRGNGKGKGKGKGWQGWLQFIDSFTHGDLLFCKLAYTCKSRRALGMLFCGSWLVYSKWGEVFVPYNQWK